MVARLQRRFAAFLLALAAGWLVAWWLGEHPLIAVVGATLILFSHALILGAEFILLWVVDRRNPTRPRRLRPATLIGAWAHEVVWAFRIFYWWQPFRSSAESDSIPPAANWRMATGVLLVHGFACNRGVWTPWMRRLRLRGVPFLALNLEPPLAEIDDYVATIESAVERLEQATRLPVVLVGHSMGGLAIRAWLARFDADSRVRRIITIGAPHQGTWLAASSPAPSARQMRPDSAWLRQLASVESAERRGRFTCFAGECDNIVYPHGCALLDGALNIEVPASAHLQLAFRPAVFAEILRWLEPATEPRSLASIEPRPVASADGGERTEPTG